jgi:high affinity sulfate transporter 1
LVLAALVIPLNIGYAQVAGLPATLGLYAGLAPVVVFALTSSTRRLMIGPSAAVAALVGAGLAPLAAAGSEHRVDLAVATSILCGAAFLVFAVLRLGVLVRYLSKAVLIGYIGGLATSVLTGQAAKVLRLQVDGSQRWISLVAESGREVGDAHLASLVIGVGTIVCMLVIRRYWPALPGALAALVITTLLVANTGFGDGVAVVGTIEGGPPSVGLPHAALTEWLRLMPIALAICALALAEGLLLARSYARAHGEDEDPDHDSAALGLANLAGGVTLAMPVGSSSSRTAAVAAGGSDTQIPALVSAGVMVVALLAFTDVIEELPLPALAGIVVVALVPLIGIPQLIELYRQRPAEFVIAITTFAGVLVLGALPAVVLGLVLSAVDVVRRAAHPPTALLGPDVSHADAVRRYSASGLPQMAAMPGLVIYRFGGPMFYVNADALREEVRDIVVRTPGLEWFVLDAEGVSDVDPTAAEAFADVIATVKDAGARFVLSRMNSHTSGLVEHYGLLADGEVLEFTSNREAVAAYHAWRAERPPPE